MSFHHSSSDFSDFLSRLDSCEVIKMEVNNNHQAGDDKREMNTSDLPPPLLPEEGAELELRVSYAVSPDNFVILPVSCEGEIRP